LVFAFLLGLNAALSLHDARVEGVDAKFFIITIALVAILIFICYKKGERPRWHWGVPDKYKNKL